MCSWTLLAFTRTRGRASSRRLLRVAQAHSSAHSGLVLRKFIQPLRAVLAEFDKYTDMVEQVMQAWCMCSCATYLHRRPAHPRACSLATVPFPPTLANTRAITVGWGTLSPVGQVIEDVGSPDPRINPTWDEELESIAVERADAEAAIAALVQLFVVRFLVSACL